MKISLNKDGDLIDSDTKKTLNRKNHPSLPQINWGDTNPYKESKNMGLAITYTNAHTEFLQEIETMEDDLSCIKDQEFVEKHTPLIKELKLDISDITPHDTANFLFNKEEDKLYDIEVSPIAAKYLKRSKQAAEVVKTNIITGVHTGITTNTENIEIMDDVYNEISNKINNLMAIIIEKFQQENPNNEEDYDDYDDYDDEEDWDDEDWDDYPEDDE